MKTRIPSIDLLRGAVMLLMVLDHVRMYFGEGTWYSNPTDLSTTTPLLFFTRWVTHICAPVFVFLVGVSAYLSGTTRKTKKELAGFLVTRGLWLVIVELIIVNFAWTFDITYSFRLLQVIWVIGISMIVLSALVFLPDTLIAGAGLILLFGHNLLDRINMDGASFSDLLWYTLHQPRFLVLDSGNVINFVYPALPWIGLMATGYVFGRLYRSDFDPTHRKKLLLRIGIGATILFIVLRMYNLYGEPSAWSEQQSTIFSLISFLDTTKYPPSLHFLLMTMGPVLTILSISESIRNRAADFIVTFGRVPFFFYVTHLYVIHVLASIYLAFQGHSWGAYVLSAEEIMSGRLGSFGVRLEAVYVIWIMIIAALYPLCSWYQTYKSDHPEKRWLSYL